MAEQVSFRGISTTRQAGRLRRRCAKRVVLEDGGHRLEEMPPEIVVSRPDLMKKVYPSGGSRATTTGRQDRHRFFSPERAELVLRPDAGAVPISSPG